LIAAASSCAAFPLSRHFRGEQMTSCKSIGTAAMVAALVSLTAVQPALAYDGVRHLPHPIVPNAPPPTEESSWQAMQQHMERRFNDAGGGGNGLTQEQARLAGWGNVSDNFKSIDRQGNGRVGLDDLKRRHWFLR
jgi:hypothetical protein